MVFNAASTPLGLRFRDNMGRGADITGFEEHYMFFTIIKDRGAFPMRVMVAVLGSLRRARSASAILLQIARTAS